MVGISKYRILQSWCQWMSRIILLVTLSACADRQGLAPVQVGTAKERPTYIVQPGDTLFSIAWKFEKDMHALAYINHLSDTSSLKPGQRLELIITSPKPASAKRYKPLPVSPTIAKKTITDKSVWTWPAHGQILHSFSLKAQRKGIDIKGKAGSPVVASRAGTVVYSGNGLRGYGNLVIIKHSEKFLSAYAYNHRNLVKEGQYVKAKQKVAIMGSQKGGIGLLHFEIRQFGQPINPMKLLTSD